MAAPQDERFDEKTIFTYFLFREGLSNHDVGVARGSLFQETWPGAGFKPGDFLEE